MDKNTIKRDEFSLLPKNISRNDEQPLETIEKNNNVKIKNDTTFNNFSFLIEDQTKINFKTSDIFKIENWENNHNTFLKDSLFEKKILPSMTKIKFANDSLIRRAKKILFNSLLKYDNYIISKFYNASIGNGITIKKLFKIDHFIIKNSNTNFNKELLNKTQGEIFSSNISTRYTSYPLDHNKRLINKLLKEKNLEKRKIFNLLFNITLSECIHYLNGEKDLNILKGLEKFYEKEFNNLGKDEEVIKELKIVIK